MEGVQEARAIARLRQLTFSGMTGARMLGLLHDAVVFLVEQLQGAGRCQRHHFRFFKQFNQEDDLPVNPSGCARSELYLRSVVPSHLHPHTCTLTPAPSHLHPHTCTLTPAPSHLHPHTCTLTPALSHLHPHTCTLTPAPSHLYPHTCTLTPAPSHLHPHTCTIITGRVCVCVCVCVTGHNTIVWTTCN